MRSRFRRYRNFKVLRFEKEIADLGLGFARGAGVWQSADRRRLEVAAVSIRRTSWLPYGSGIFRCARGAMAVCMVRQAIVVSAAKS